MGPSRAPTGGSATTAAAAASAHQAGHARTHALRPSRAPSTVALPVEDPAREALAAAARVLLAPPAAGQAAPVVPLRRVGL